MNTNEAQVLLAQAKAAIEADDFQSARTILARLVQVYPDTEEAWLLLAHISTDKDRTITFLEQVLRINPTNRSISDQLGRMKSGEIDEVHLFAGLNKPKIIPPPIAFEDRGVEDNIQLNLPRAESPRYPVEQTSVKPLTPTSPPIIPSRKPIIPKQEQFIHPAMPTQLEEKQQLPLQKPPAQKNAYWVNQPTPAQQAPAQVTPVKKRGSRFFPFLIGLALILIPIYYIQNNSINLYYEGYEIFIAGGIGLFLMIFLRKSRWLSGCGWGLFIGVLITFIYFYFIY